MRTWPALEISRLEPSSHRATETSDDLPDLLQAALTDHDVVAIENIPHGWRVFFATPGSRKNAASVLLHQYPEQSITELDVPDDDWAARSQANLTAVRVGDIIVAPPWDIPAERTGGATASGRTPVVIVVQPSMGFGTGHHATTRRCLDALQALNLTGCSVMDIGTGSGVLAIAASFLGAARVLGIDDDPDAIGAAAENLVLNGVTNVTLRVADLRQGMYSRCDVVLANLTGALLSAAADRIQSVTTAQGRMVLSGFMSSEEQVVLAAFPDCSIEWRTAEDEWLCVTLKREHP